MRPEAHVLVTGGGGYLGGVLVPMLLERGYYVTICDTFYFGRRSVEQLTCNDHLRIIQADVRFLDPLLLKNVDAVIHLAAISNDIACEIDPSWTQSVNRNAVERLVQLAEEQEVRRFLLASSCSVYGSGGEEILTETAALHPVSLYAQSKAWAEEAVMKKTGRDSFQSVSLRLATLFGLAPRMRFDLAINIMTLSAITRKSIRVAGGGQQWRPFLHVLDAARAFLICLESPLQTSTPNVFNVVAANFQIGPLASLIAERIGGVTIKLSEDVPDRRNYQVSGASFTNRFGFTPMAGVEFGVDQISDAIRRGTLGDLGNANYYTLQTLRQVYKASIERQNGQN